jgi:hypothetical protein
LISQPPSPVLQVFAAQLVEATLGQRIVVYITTEPRSRLGPLGSVGTAGVAYRLDLLFGVPTSFRQFREQLCFQLRRCKLRVAGHAGECAQPLLLVAAGVSVIGAGEPRSLTALRRWCVADKAAGAQSLPIWLGIRGGAQRIPIFDPA